MTTEIKEKVKFIDSYSHVFANILTEAVDEDIRVLEVLTEMIISDKPLNSCRNIMELKELVQYYDNDYLSLKRNDAFNSYSVIFSVANYINTLELDDKDKVRNKLRTYTRVFRNNKVISSEYQRFLVFDNKQDKDKVLLKERI